MPQNLWFCICMWVELDLMQDLDVEFEHKVEHEELLKAKYACNIWQCDAFDLCCVFKIEHVYQVYSSWMMIWSWKWDGDFGDFIDKFSGQ